MQNAFNAYVLRVLENMTASDIDLRDAKRVCRSNLQFLERAYVNLTDTKVVSATLLAA